MGPQLQRHGARPAHGRNRGEDETREMEQSIKAFCLFGERERERGNGHFLIPVFAIKRYYREGLRLKQGITTKGMWEWVE